ncbi:hypothetical protein [Bacteroides cellulosilyticus]|uniref:hypothetical protein n=1 Tax=Bacteroides cellulosilyticus TaxID=246787 RepID=UPI0032BFF0A7
MSYDFLNDNGDYEAGREAMKKEAIEALSSVLENWVHGGDADCIKNSNEHRTNRR